MRREGGLRAAFSFMTMSLSVLSIDSVVAWTTVSHGEASLAWGGSSSPRVVEGFARGETPTIVRIDPLVPCRNLQLARAPASPGRAFEAPRSLPCAGLLLTWFLLFGHSPANFLPGAQPKLDLGAPEDTPSEGRAPWPCVVGRLRGAFDWGPTLDRVEIFFPDTGPAREFHQLQPRQGSTTSSPPG